jgi:hypothetical protein
MNHLRCRRAVSAGLVAVLAAFASAAAAADAVDVFEVKDVAVDVTAATAAEAREEALVQGEITAFQRLLERLTLRGHRDKLPELPKADIDIYVQDFSVADEKASSVRYLARLNFRFKPEEVRRLLHDFGIPFAETVSKPVLVLPVFQDAGALILWDDPNPWREAWLSRPPTHGLVPTILPVGDLADMAAIGAEQAMDGDAQRLNAIAARYGASDALVVFGVLRFDAANNRRVLEVYFTRYGQQLREQTEVTTFTQEKIETTPQLLLRAARALTEIVEDNWKRDNLLQLTRSGVVAAVVPITGLRDWLAVRKRLGQVAVVRKAEMVLLSQDEVRVNLHFVGDAQQLALALEQADLRLFEESGEWLLTLLEPPPGAPPGQSPGPASKGAPTAPVAAGRPPGKS